MSVDPNLKKLLPVQVRYIFWNYAQAELDNSSTSYATYVIFFPKIFGEILKHFDVVY